MGESVRFVRFSFKNFKGLRRATLQLSPDAGESAIVTLVGLNESGKTTVLEAIDKFYPGKEQEEIRPKDILGIGSIEPFDLIPIANRGNFNDVVEIIATVRLDQADKKRISARVARSTGFRVKDLPDEISITNRYTFENSRLRESTTLWPRQIGSGFTKQGTALQPITSVKRRSDWQAILAEVRESMPQIWYFPNFLFDFPESVQLNQSADEDVRNRLFRELLQDILRSVDDSATLQEHVVDRALSSDPADRTSLNQIRLQIGAEVTKTVVSRWNSVFGGDGLLGKRIFFEVAVDTTRPGVVLGQFLLEDGTELFSIRERSLGFRWFFVYLLLTTYRARRTGESSIVYLLDEPASNLHSSAQALLLESLQRLGEDAQIIYTTHSHHLVNPEWLQSTFVVSNEGVDPSSITSDVVSKRTDIKVTRYPEFANQHPGKQHYFQPVLDVLAYRPGNLEMVSDVVMTEGKTDFYLIQYYLHVLHESAPRLRILPGRGAGSLDEVVRLYLGWGKNFIILLDSDQGGQEAARHYQRQFGKIVQDRVFDLAEASGFTSGKGIESILDDEDRISLQRVIDPAAARWSKRAWSQGLEHALATRTRVDISDASMARLAELCRFLATQLEDRRPDALS